MESAKSSESLYNMSQGHRVALGLKLSRLELHLVRIAALSAGTDPATYARDALRVRLENDLGHEEVERRWTP